MSIRAYIFELTGIDIKADVSIDELLENPKKYVDNERDLKKLLDVIYLLQNREMRKRNGYR